jgi:hypothetical protein
MPLVPPNRHDIESRWLAVARAELSRESVSTWAEEFMLADYEENPDVMVMQALQYLHGFDMTYRSSDQRFIGHGPPGPYVRTLDQVSLELDEWRRRCAAYDADPSGWPAARRQAARSKMRPPAQQ